MSIPRRAAKPAARVPAEMPVGELISQCVAGDDAARALFVAEYEAVVRRAVLYHMRNIGQAAPVRSEAEDICHEVFERIFEHQCRRLAELRRPESIRYWLMAVARNQVMTSLREWNARNRLHEAVRQDAFQPDPPPSSVLAIAGETAERIRTGLAALPAKDRLVLELYYLQGLHYHEIAEMTGRTIGVVSSHLHRAKQKLRIILESAADGDKES